MKRFDAIILTVAIALIMGGIGFGIGRVTAGKAVVATSGGAGSTGGQSGFEGGFGGRHGGRPVFGTVASISGDTLTITGQDGTSHTVTLTASTAYTNGDGSSATQASLVAGTSVAAFGSADSSGVVTATRVIANPSVPGGTPPSSTQSN
jgi:hypothetical protein